jgi:hypothetical protein
MHARIESEMASSTMIRDNTRASDNRFRATAQGFQADGKTVGTALDALLVKIGDATNDGMILVVIRRVPQEPSPPRCH